MTDISKDESVRLIAKLNGHRQASVEKGFHTSALLALESIEFIRAQAARIEQLEADMGIMTDTIGSLLCRVDEAYAPECGGLSMHAFGQSPDWFVEAAYQACYGRPTDHARSAAALITEEPS